MRRHRGHQHRAGAHAAMTANCHRSQYRRAAEDRHRILDRRVAFDRLRRGAAERNSLVERHVIANLARLADHHAHAVIDKKAPADFRSGMNLYPGENAAYMTNETREWGEIPLPEPMVSPVQQGRM